MRKKAGRYKVSECQVRSACLDVMMSTIRTDERTRDRSGGGLVWFGF